MKAAVCLTNSQHQQTWGAAMVAGLKKHGIQVELLRYEQTAKCDFVVMWGWRHHRKVKGKPILLMERGHVPDRMQYTSLGWNGLARHGRYAAIDDGGARWRTHWGHLLQPWNADGTYDLILGQVNGDQSLHGTNVEQWADDVCRILRKRGREIIYRPHPIVVQRGHRFHPKGAQPSRGSLAEDVAGASRVIAYCSTASVESVLAGKPTITMDAGAMAWEMTSHGLDEPIVMPDREAWAHRLAWAQYTMEEIASGFAWEQVATANPLLDAMKEGSYAT